MALKLASFPYFNAHGYSEARAHNDTANPPILALNENLGYRRLPGCLAWEKELDLQRRPGCGCGSTASREISRGVAWG
jgi:hypothetical protein